MSIRSGEYSIVQYSRSSPVPRKPILVSPVARNWFVPRILAEDAIPKEANEHATTGGRIVPVRFNPTGR